MPATLTLLQGAREFFPALIEAIDASSSAIYLESYLIHDDPPTRAVLEALVRARMRGVAVCVLLDGFGAADRLAWIRQLLQPHGVEVEAYRPGVRWLAPRTWRRLHRKLVLVDEQVAFIGGINLIDDRFDLVHGQLAEPRLDFAIRVTTSRAVTSVSMVMRRLWWRVSLRNAVRGSLGRLLSADKRQSEVAQIRQTWRRTRRHLRWRGPRRSRMNPSRRIRLLLRDNVRHRHGIEHWYLWKIRRAAHDILIANAYFVPTYRFRQALIRAAQRGVRVRLLIQGNSDQWWTDWATQALIGELVGAGVEVYEYIPSFLHAKVAVIDDAMTVGSSNIDPFSLTLSLEANLMVDDPVMASDLRTRLETVIAAASRRLQPRTPLRSPWRAIVRAATLTFALAALRAFVALSGRRFRI